MKTYSKIFTTKISFQELEKIETANGSNLKTVLTIAKVSCMALFEDPTIKFPKLAATN